jgi:ATP-dependent HslUV protease, peptidase subunit HslV
MLTRAGMAFSTMQWHHTTILAIKRNQQTVIIGDGQVSLGPTIIKTNAKKIRPLAGGPFCGFAGSVADAFALMEGLEQVMSRYPKQTLKSCISYAKEWRTGKQLRHLEATLIVIDKDLIIELDGTGNVIEIDDVIGVGSGGLFAESAAKALLEHTQMGAEEIARAAMKIAADKCVYTSHAWVL